jgi:hypothetical protein
MCPMLSMPSVSPSMPPAWPTRQESREIQVLMYSRNLQEAQANLRVRPRETPDRTLLKIRTPQARMKAPGVFRAACQLSSS